MKLALWICAICLAVSGCSSGEKELKLVSITGVVKYKDAPVADAEVHFYPASGPLGIGKTDAKGYFSITTNGKSGGIPGKNKVTVASKPEAAIPPSDGRAMDFVNKSKLPEKYSDQNTTDLIVDVSATGSKETPLNLTD